MRIGINISYWVPNAMGGTQTYQRQLLEGLAAAGDEHEFIVFLNADGGRQFQGPSPRFRTYLYPLAGRFRLLRVLWEQVVVPTRLRAMGIDVLHSLGYLSPIAAPGATVATVHDMIHYIYPQDIEPLKRLGWHILFPLSLRRLDCAIVSAESVRRELAQFFPWSAAKTAVVPLAVDPTLFCPGPVVPCAAAHGKPFLLAVSTISPHKNTVRLVEAFARVRQELPALDLQLVLVGLIRPEQGALVRRTAKALGVSNQVILTGRVSDEELIQYYRSAEMLVFPSLYEGFGFPPLEAMSCGCPVVASNQASMPEVTGNAALLFHPRDVQDMADRICEMLTSGNKRRQWVERGLERAKLYRWEYTVQRTLDVYRQCLRRRAEMGRKQALHTPGEDVC